MVLGWGVQHGGQERESLCATLSLSLGKIRRFIFVTYDGKQGRVARGESKDYIILVVATKKLAILQSRTSNSMVSILSNSVSLKYPALSQKKGYVFHSISYLSFSSGETELFGLRRIFKNQTVR